MSENPHGTEDELKLALLGDQPIERIVAAAGGAAGVSSLQVNTYFDSTAHRLQEARYMVRLRADDDRHVVTLKGPGVSRGSVASRPEEEVEIGPGLARQILEGTVSPLRPLEGGPEKRQALVGAIRSTLGEADLAPIGSVQNRRTRVPLRVEADGEPVEVVLELDETTFPGGVVHHEVEVELPPGASASAVETGLRDLLARAGVEARLSTPKVQRFFEALAGTLQ
jgi:uncharacterized protein YjbK